MTMTHSEAMDIRLLERRCAFGKMYSFKGLQSKSAPRLKYGQLTETDDRCHVRDDRRRSLMFWSISSQQVF